MLGAEQLKVSDKYKSRIKPIGMSIAGLMTSAALIACGGEAKASVTPSADPAGSTSTEKKVTPITPPVTVESNESALTAEEMVIAYASDKLKPGYIPKISNFKEEPRLDKGTKMKTLSSSGVAGVDPYFVTLMAEEKMTDATPTEWYVAIQQAGLPDSNLDTALTLMGKYFKDVPLPTDTWNDPKKKDKTISYELIIDNPDKSFDSVIAIVSPGVTNPDKFVARIGFCHTTSESARYNSRTCL